MCRSSWLGGFGQCKGSESQRHRNPSVLRQMVLAGLVASGTERWDVPNGGRWPWTCRGGLRHYRVSQIIVWASGMKQGAERAGGNDCLLSCKLHRL